MKLNKIPNVIRLDVIKIIPTLNLSNVNNFIEILLKYFYENNLSFCKLDANKVSNYKEEVLFLIKNDKERYNLFDIFLYLIMINNENKPPRVTKEDLKYIGWHNTDKK